MPAVLASDDFSEFRSVCQIPVVCNANAVGCIDIERLSFGSCIATSCRVAYVTNAVVALQLQHVLLLEDIADEPTSLAGVQLAVDGGCNARSVLAAMLQDCQRVIDSIVDCAGSDN